MRIAMIAPPWIPVPAPAYGGIEEVVYLLCEGLVERGHDVTLFAPPGSRSCARVRAMLDEAHPDEIERARWEVDHVARAFAAIDDAANGEYPFDVVHDHCGFAALAMADRLQTPLVHTLHAPLDGQARAFYAAHGHKGTLVAISHAQREDAPPALRDGPVVYNPLRFSDWRLGTDPGDHVLWLGRMAEVKGPHRAIRAATAADVRLVLAGPVQPGFEEFFEHKVQPRLDGDRVRYVGELGGRDKARAFAQARALLMPIRWAEPFGMVMTEAMACGTPVIAFAEGSAPEVVTDGVTGFVVDDEAGMTAAIGRIDELDRTRCRDHAERCFGIEAALDGYEEVYQQAAHGAVAGATDRRATSTTHRGQALRHPRRRAAQPAR